jgi:hypothetical protein
VATTEELPIAFDYSLNVVAGDVVASPSAVLHNPDTGAVITPTDAPTVSGNLVIQIIRGSQLTARQMLRLDVTATLNAAKVITASLYIACPY